MGYAQFRAGFAGDASNEWSVSASDTFLKQNEDTHIVVRYNPHSPGVSNAFLVIEAEVRCQSSQYPNAQLDSVSNFFRLLQDFKMTWKVVGSTGEYEF